MIKANSYSAKDIAAASALAKRAHLPRYMTDTEEGVLAICRLVDEVRRSGPNNEATWIPITERRPEGRQEVIVATDAGMVSTRGARWIQALYAEACDEGIAPVITHWMPLPSAPTTEAPQVPEPRADRPGDMDHPPACASTTATVQRIPEDK